MKRRFQLELSIRELDVPDEQARGVRFSENVSAEEFFDYLNRVRDAIITIIGGNDNLKKVSSPITTSVPGNALSGHIYPKKKQYETMRYSSRSGGGGWDEFR